MPVRCLEEGRTLTVKVAGEVDHHAAKAVMTELSREVDAALPRAVRLDLGDVSFMDSSGIAVVLRTWRMMRELGGSVELSRVPRQAAKVLRAAGVEKLIPFGEEE